MGQCRWVIVAVFPYHLIDGKRHLISHRASWNNVLICWIPWKFENHFQLTCRIGTFACLVMGDHWTTLLWATCHCDYSSRHLSKPTSLTVLTLISRFPKMMNSQQIQWNYCNPGDPPDFLAQSFLCCDDSHPLGSAQILKWCANLQWLVNGTHHCRWPCKMAWILRSHPRVLHLK
jgi:hypothetical protein